ncbi:MAG: ABC transporter ATP-binding protein [Nitrospirae bacterium YQR-1]
MLQLKLINKHFGGVRALCDVSLEVTAGRIVGLIGPNGAGKTTLFNIITSITKPDSGRIIFDGKDITGLRPFRVAKLGIGRTFQNIKLFGRMEVVENVMAGMHCVSRGGICRCAFKFSNYRQDEKLLHEKAQRLLSFVGLEGKGDELSESFSYGQQRRIEIARALALNPRLLLLDEPVSGMNETETQDIMRLIKEIRNSGVSVLLIEHDMGLIMGVCDTVIVLNIGLVIAVGSPEEIQRNPVVIEAYLGNAPVRDKSAHT